MPAAEPEHSPAEPQAPTAAESVRRGRRRKVKVGAPRATAGAAILYGLGGLKVDWGRAGGKKGLPPCDSGFPAAGGDAGEEGEAAGEGEAAR